MPSPLPKIDIIEFVLGLDDKALLRPDTAGYTPVHRYMLNSHISGDVVRYVMEREPHGFNVLSKLGLTPVHRYMGNKRISPDIIDMLVEHDPGALNHVDQSGSTPVHWYCATNKNAGYEDDDIIQTFKVGFTLNSTVVVEARVLVASIQRVLFWAVLPLLLFLSLTRNPNRNSATPQLKGYR